MHLCLVPSGQVGEVDVSRDNISYDLLKRPFLYFWARITKTLKGFMISAVLFANVSSASIHSLGDTLQVDHVGLEAQHSEHDHCGPDGGQEVDQRDQQQLLSFLV